MARQMGRPKADNPKSVIVKTRIDADTEARLKAYCARHNLTTTDVLRKGIALVLGEKNTDSGSTLTK